MDDTLDLSGFQHAWGDLVSFYLGCSFTFEPALVSAGVRLPQMEQNRNTSMYLTNIPLRPVGKFGGRMFTSMRLVERSKLAEVFCLTSRYPQAHGAPIHVGDPARIGVRDLSTPSAGDPPVFEAGGNQVPVFWACGFSVSQILADVGKLAFFVAVCA